MNKSDNEALQKWDTAQDVLGHLQEARPTSLKPRSTARRGRSLARSTNEVLLENQNLHIVGCRPLDKTEIDLINEVKKLANFVGETLARFERVSGMDKHWAGIARTQLQLGFMALDRAVAKPTSF